MPHEISELHKLGYLKLNNNQLTGTLPPTISQLSRLQELDLSNNQLAGTIPQEIAQLSKLQRLYLNDNHLTGSIPHEISQLSKFQELKLNNNQLTKFYEEMRLILTFKCLCKYMIENENEQSISPELSQLTNEEYEKAKNIIRNTENFQPMLKNFYAYEFRQFLRILEMTNTKQKQLPESVRENKIFIVWYYMAFQKTRVHISMIPQLQPGQENTAEQVKAYYELIQKGMSQAKRGNLFIVGQEGVGKTSMVKNIMGEAWTGSAICHTDSKENLSSPKIKSIESKRYNVTDGVDRHQWIIQSDGEVPITMTLQDFAGQAIYQETHSFLLNASDSIVVLMFDISIGLHENRVAHWIYTLSSRVPGALLFLVASHIDRLKPKQAEKTFRSIHNQLEGLCFDINASISPANRLKLVSPSKEQQGGGENPFIFWTINNLQKCNVSSKPALFLQIEQSIQKHIQSREVPQSFIDLHNRLEEEYQQMEKDAMPVIRCQRLEEIANELGLTNKSMIQQALQVISGWGNILIFPDDIFHGEKQTTKKSEVNVTALLNPNWLINAFKSIVSVQYLPQGIFSAVATWLKKIVQKDPSVHKQAQVSKSEIGKRLQEFESKDDEDLSEEEITSVVNMLQSLQMIIPMHSQTQEEFFVPSMLYGIQPGKLTPSKKELEIIRSYSLRFLPSGLFSRFMVCVVRCFGSMSDVVSAWDGGFVMIPSHSPENEIRIFTETNSGIGKTIHLHVFGDSSEANYQSFGKIMETLHQQMMFLLNDMEHGNLQISCSLVRNGKQEATGAFRECLKESLSQQPSVSHDLLKYLVPEIYLSLGCKFYDLPSLGEVSFVNPENYENFSPHEIRSNQLGNIVTLKRLGQGVQGFVDLGELTSSLHATEHCKVAIKFPFPDKLDVFEIENLMKEVSLLRLLNHRNLVRLLDVVIQPLPGLPLAIIAAFCPGGDLDVDPGKERTFDVLVVMRIARDVAAALGYLHSRNPPVLHLDVSGRNVFLVEARVDARVCAVLGDVGCAQSVHHETKRVGIWSIGSDVTMYCSFLKQLMSGSVGQDQREHPAFEQLDALCHEIENDPDSIQFTQVASSLDKYLSNHCLEEAEEEPKVCSELRKLFEEYGGAEKMNKLGMEKMIELLAPEDIVLIKDGESSQWKSVCKMIYPVAARIVKENFIEMMDELARIGFVDVGDDEDDGNSLLHIAAILGHHEMMHHVLRGLHVDVNIPNRHRKKHRAIHFAASCGKIECISLLLDYWAIIDATDSQGQTALFKAAEGGYFETVQLLALRGANVNVVVQGHDTENIVPIISAARFDHRQCVTELLRFGANISSIQRIHMTSSEKILIQERARLLLESSKASCSPVRQQSIEEWLKI